MELFMFYFMAGLNREKTENTFGEAIRNQLQTIITTVMPSNFEIITITMKQMKKCLINCSRLKATLFIIGTF